MAKVNWNGKRTLEHCSLITQCVKSGLEKPRHTMENAMDIKSQQIVMSHAKNVQNVN